MVEVCIKIIGRVQGVGFRKWFKKNALNLKLFGWVTNNSDGSVTAAIKGNDYDVEQMIALCKKGPLFSKVTEIKRLNENPNPNINILEGEFKII